MMRKFAVLIGLVATMSLGWGASAFAATIKYTLSGVASGEAFDIATKTDLGPFSGIPLAIVAYGDTPGLHLSGQATVVSLTSAYLVSGPNAYLINGLDAQAVFAVGEGVFSGEAIFGEFDGTNYTTSVDFMGAGLVGFNGISNLAPTPVTFSQFDPLSFNAFGEDIGVEFTSFDNAMFSASVPEPATWAMMLAGFLGLGAVTRARRRARSVAAA